VTHSQLVGKRRFKKRRTVLADGIRRGGGVLEGKLAAQGSGNQGRWSNSIAVGCVEGREEKNRV